MPFSSDRSDIDYANYAAKPEEAEQETLVFPINVAESIKAASGLKTNEKLGLIASFWLFGCGVVMWFLYNWLHTITAQYAFLFTLLVFVLLQLTVGMYLLRFALDENSLLMELDSADLSFTHYFKIYKDIKATDGSRYPFDVIEFDDGSYGVFIECRLGHNTQLRSDATYYANKNVIETLNKYGLCYKIYYHNEDFKSSESAEQMLDMLKGIRDQNLFSAYRDIVQNYLDIAQNESNVFCAVYLVYARTRIEKDDLLSAMNLIFSGFEKEETMYRQISVLKYDDIVEFLRREYRLEVLDMGAIRAFIAEKKNKYNCPVKVLKIYGESGKIYANSAFKELNNDVIKENGLTSVN